MKAEVNGVKLEGTPAEIAEVIRLVGAAQESKESIRYVPIPNYTPPKPFEPPYSPWGTTIDCAELTTMLENYKRARNIFNGTHTIGC